MCDLAKSSFGLTILPLESFFSETLLHDDGLSDGYKKKFRSVEIWNQDVCLLPINTGKVHWSLLVIIPKQKTFLYLDSLHWDPDPLLLNRICAALEWTTIKNVKSKKFKWAEWTLFKPTDNPTQNANNSSNNCGVHVCTWIHIICTGSSNVFDDSHMINVRKAIATILNGRIIKKLSIGKSHEQLPKIRKSSRTFQKMQQRSTPPLEYASTLEYCSSLVYSIIESEPSMSDGSSYSYTDEHISVSSLKESQQEQEDDEESDNEESIENIKENNEETCQNIGRNAVSFTNIFENSNAYPHNFFNQKINLFGIHLIKETLQSLDGFTYIDDSVIDIFLLLLGEHAEKGRNLKVLMFPAFMVGAIMDMDSCMNFVGWAKEVDMWKQKIWLLPVNLDNTHWTLLVVIPDRQEMIYIDPLHYKIPDGLLSGISSYMDLVPHRRDMRETLNKLNKI